METMIKENNNTRTTTIKENINKILKEFQSILVKLVKT